MTFVRTNLKNSSLWLAVLLVALLGARPASAVVLDWSAVTWTAGSLSQSFDIDPANPGNDITITLTPSGANNFSAGRPVNNLLHEGGLAPPVSSLDLRMMWPDLTSSVLVTVKFNYANGVDGVNFKLFDIDEGTTFKDVVADFRSNFKGGANLAPTSVTGSASNIKTGAGITQAVSGNGIVVPDTGAGSGAGNATIDFGSTLIDQFTFVYRSDPAFMINPPGVQGIGIYNINYRPKVPEVNPALAAMLVCGLAIGARLRRRTKTSRALSVL